MKKSFRIITGILCVAMLGLCLCGCNDLDKMREAQAVWTVENQTDSITYNDAEYKKVSNEIMPEKINIRQDLVTSEIFVTQPDVPVLLSQANCLKLNANKEKTILFGYLPKNIDIQEASGQIFSSEAVKLEEELIIYIRSDLYNKVISEFKNGIKTDSYGYSYCNEKNRESYHVLTDEEKSFIDKLIKTTTPEKNPDSIELCDYITSIEKMSDDGLFMQSFLEINIDNNGDIYIFEYGSDTYTYASAIKVPQEHKSQLENIVRFSDYYSMNNNM